MAKILTVSDIHIHDYPQRNPSEKYRLYQTRTVAENIIEAGKEAGCDYIVFAGDILEKSVIRPYVQSEVKLFLDRIMSEFKEGWIIWGNHDIDSKSQEQLASDTCLSVMLPTNLHYADGQQIYLDSSTIAFSNWKPKFDLSWIRGTVDVLFTHATISYFPGDPYQSQEMDESKFNLAICGDIHKMAQRDKYVSIGIPQRCKMGDSELSSGVIYDTVTKTWEWVNLNPKENLLKMQYTDNPEIEGYHPELNTWLIYQPSNVSRTETGIRNIIIPEWEKIEKLTQDIIVSNGLANVHSEVLRNCKDLESLEVDFNFTLTRFYCKNWRSIEEAQVYFNEGDRILIRGANGSGKSSLLSAIKYAFTENRFLKEFIQFGSKECLTEVEFIYQGKRCLIQRGTKKYGLFVDDIQISYGSKKEFEEDMHIRFPFIDYMDVFFFDEDHLKLIGDIAPERKSEIISKFFKLDKIDYFNQVATDMLNLRTKGISGVKEEMIVCQRMIEELDQRLSSVVLPTVPLAKLKKDYSDAISLQSKYLEYMKYLESFSEMNSSLHLYEVNLAKAVGEIELYPQVGVIEAEIANIDSELSGLRSQESSLRYTKDKKRSLEQDLQRIKNEGSEVWTKLNMMKESSICPTCKQVVSRSELSGEIEATELKFKELLTQQEQCVRDLAEIDRIIASYPELGSKIRELENEKMTLNTQILTIKRAKETQAECQRNINRIKESMGILRIPKKVELPEGFMETLTSLREGILLWENWENSKIEKENYQTKLDEFTAQVCGIQGEINLLNAYIDLTGTTGKIYEEIMTRLSKDFSDNQVKYEIITYDFRRKKHLDLASYYNKSGNWVSYTAASSGQKTVLDINFLSKVVTRMGLLIMDEFLKSLDAENHDLCIDMIDNMNVGCIMLSSHMETIGKFNNKSMNLALNDSGSTVINLTLE